VPGAPAPGATVASGWTEEDNAFIAWHRASPPPMRVSVIDRGGLFERLASPMAGPTADAKFGPSHAEGPRISMFICEGLRPASGPSHAG